MGVQDRVGPAADVESLEESASKLPGPDVHFHLAFMCSDLIKGDRIYGPQSMTFSVVV